jgi:hypothetical protein
MTATPTLDEANVPIAKQLRGACHDTLPWLISFSLNGYFYAANST